MNAQGASQEEIQRAITTRASSSASPSPTGENKVGWKQQLTRDIAKPFLKTATSAAFAIRGGLGDYDPEKMAKAAEEGVDYGFFGKVKPFGSQFLEEDTTVGDQAKRAGLEIAGNMAEIASYGMAPLHGLKGAGFWSTAIKGAAPFSATFGLGKGLQAAGEGKGAGEATLEGAGAYLGSALGYGFMGKGAQLMGRWGARAIQQPGVKAAGKAIMNLAEKVWTAMPESFQTKGAEFVSSIINASTRRATSALKSEYAQTHKQAVNAWIEATSPNVANPDLALGEFQRSLSSEIGGMFRKSASLYDDFKAADPISETASDWFSTNKAIDSIPKNNPLSYYFTALKQSLGKPNSPRQILSTYEQLMSDITKAQTNEEKTVIREVANSLYADMRKIMTSKNILDSEGNPLVNKWDEAYQSWKKASDTYESSPLNQLKTTGDVDTIVDKMATKSLTRSEQNTLFNAMQDNPEPIRELVISSLLRKTQGMEPQEGAKLIRNFLDGWDFKVGGDDVNGFLDPKQAAYLDDLASYMEENFTDFLGGMRKTVGVADEVTPKLAEEQAKLNIAELVDKGDFEGIATNWSKISGTDDFAGALKLLSPEEKKVVGLSLWRNMFDEKLPLITTNADGTLNLETFAKAFKESFAELNRIGGGKKTSVLKDLYSKEQLDDFFKANKMLETYGDVSQIPKGAMKSMFNSILAVMYSIAGHQPMAAKQAGQAFAQPSKKEFYTAMDSLIEAGLVKKNWQLNVSDVLQLLEMPAGAAGGQITS